MARIQIPLDALTSRLNLGSRFDGVRSQSLSTRFANLKPISEFLNLSRLSKPANFGEVQNRVNYNLGYFSSNYVAVAIMLLIYSLLTNLTLLFDIIFVGIGLFGIKKLDGRDLELGFARATTSQLYTGLFVIAVPMFILANPIGSALCFFRGGGLGGRPRTPKFTPSWGRSSWSEARPRQKPPERYFEEFDSDDDDGQGVTLNGNYYGDELHFTGADLGSYTTNRRTHDQEHDSGSSEGDQASEDRPASTMQVALRNKEDLLLQQALERIRRAQMLGKHDVELSQPEIDALERKRRQDEAKRTRAGSGSKQIDKRRSIGQLQLAGKDIKLGKRKSFALNPTFQRTYTPEGRGVINPSIVAPGRDGRPTHTPNELYPTASQRPSSNRSSRSDSRAGSSSNLRRSTPPDPSSQYWSGPSRYPSESDYAPSSPGLPLMRRLPDHPHWNPRPRSASSNYQYPLDAQYYQPYPPTPPPNSAYHSQGRRIVSGPAEVQYPSISRRPLPMTSVHAASSDPVLSRKTHRSERDRDDSASAGETEDDDDAYGVQVDVLPIDHRYEVRREAHPLPEPRPRKTQR